MANSERDSTGDKHSPTFTAEELLDVARRIMESSDAILIGGQALNLWAEKYKSQFAELRHLAPFESKDIDFLGSVKDVQACEAALGGKARYPSPDDATPEVGVVDFNVHGKPLQIDFLGSVAGLGNKAIREAALRENYNGADIRVLHPINILQSRLSNICGALGRTDALAFRQMRAAVYVAIAFITEEALKNERRARDHIEKVFKIAWSTEALKLWHKYGIDIAEPVREYPGLNKRFVEKRLAQMRRQLDARRARYAKTQDGRAARKRKK